jgi:uncharacterized membrane protein YidH (DUF202 family)
MRDPGLQPERTALAWSRTTLSMLVTAAISLKSGAQLHGPEISIFGSCLLIGFVFTCMLGKARRNAMLHTGAAISPSGFFIATMAIAALASSVAVMAVLVRKLSLPLSF